jgi:hypothetical protein
MMEGYFIMMLAKAPHSRWQPQLHNGRHEAVEARPMISKVLYLSTFMLFAAL